MVKSQTIRLILSIVVTQNVFLHGDLTELVYMAQLQGFVHSQFPHHVCHLKKAIYGLKQVLSYWFHKLNYQLFALEFIASKAASTLFIYHTPALEIFVLIYVDDILVTGSTVVGIDGLLHILRSALPIKDLGTINYFLGIRATI